MSSGVRPSAPKVEAPPRDIPQRTRTTRHRTGTMRILRARCRIVTIRCGIDWRRCRVVRREAATERYIAAISGDDVTLIPEKPHRLGATRHCSRSMRRRKRRRRKRSTGCRIVSIRCGIQWRRCDVVPGEAASSPSDAASASTLPRRIRRRHDLPVRCDIVEVRRGAGRIDAEAEGYRGAPDATQETAFPEKPRPRRADETSPQEKPRPGQRSRNVPGRCGSAGCCRIVGSR